MSYLDELADPVMLAPVSSWRPQVNQFPILPSYIGTLGSPTTESALTWGIWRTLNGSLPLSPAGFKIHVAPRLEDIDQALELSMEVARRLDITIKHVARREYLWALYSKNAPRANAGKAIVLYPPAEKLTTCLHLLQEKLSHLTGPPIPGDFRLADSIIHLRFGAFELTRSTAYDEHGRPLIIGPDGQTRSDERTSTPRLADRPFLPDIFRTPTAADSAAIPERFDVTSAISLHAGGGVYRAVDRSTGERIVLKRGIREIGLDGRGLDAADRIAHEATVLRHLAASAKFEGRVPKVLDEFTIGGNHFIALDELAGMSLYEWVASRSPIYSGDERHSSQYKRLVDAYVAQVADVGHRLRSLIRALRRVGVVHNDIQPANVLVAEDGGVALVDFEAASSGQASGIRGVPWVYGASRDYSEMSDLDAVSKLLVYAYWPPVVSAHLDDSWSARFRQQAERYFPNQPTVTALAGLADHNHDWKEGAPSGGEVLGAYARAVSRFLDTGLGLPFTLLTPTGDPDNRSAASFGKGILSALLLPSGEGDVGRAQRRVVDLLANGPSLPLRTSDLGLVQGVGLVAPALRYHGHQEEASKWQSAYLDQVRTLDVSTVSWRISTGLAGVLIALLMAFGEQSTSASAADEIDRIARVLIARSHELLAAENSDRDPRSSMGLMGGASGVALALELWARWSGESALESRDLLNWELDQYRMVNGGLYYVDETRRFRPYLDRGNAGLIVAASEVLTADELHESRWSAVARGLHTGIGVAPGLMTGAAGLLIAAGQLERHGVDAGHRSVAVRELRADLLSMVVSTPSGHLPPGDLSRRVSLDGATGAGGVAVALSSVDQETSPFGGFLGTRDGIKRRRRAAI